MVTCPSCARHIRDEEAACPFCSAGPRAPRRAALAAGVASAVLSLSACYGAPPRRDEDMQPAQVAPVTTRE